MCVKSISTLIIYTVTGYVHSFSPSRNSIGEASSSDSWWKCNVIARRDWLVGIPLAICLAATAVSEGSWVAAAANSGANRGAGMIFLLINLSILVLCGFYRPVAIFLTTISALMAAATNPPPSRPDLLGLMFILLSIALWIRIRQRHVAILAPNPSERGL